MKKTLLGLGILAVSLSASAQNRKSAIEWPSYSTIISEQPEGENITDVIGKNFAYTYEQNQMMRQQTYNGVASYVKGTDGNIYIYNPVPGYRAGSYLKLEPTSDGRYVAHTPQAIGYDEYYGETIYIMRLVAKEENGKVKWVLDERENGEIDGDVYFTYTDGVLRQQRIEGEVFGDPKALLATVYRGGSLEGSAVGELTIMPNPYEAVKLPEGVTPVPYNMSFSTNYNESLTAKASVAFDGEDVYLSDPENPSNGYWIKGSYSNGVITVKPQYVGADNVWNVHYFLLPGKIVETDAGKTLGLVETMVLKVDEQKNTITSEPDYVYIIAADMKGGRLLESYIMPSYSKIEVKPAVPAAPEFYDVSDYDSYYGREVRFYLHSKDVDGNPIDADGLSYRVYVGADSVYTFTPDKYTRLEAPMSLVAYSFSDQYDFPAAANDYHRFYFYEDELDALGLQSVYTAGGVTNVSEITWWKEPVGTSVSGLDADVKPVRTDWFDMQGRRVASPSKGVYVVRKTMPDGSVITSKHVKR